MAMVGDLKGIADADRAAKRKALDIIEGKIIAGSVAQLIERFRDEITPTHYPDQSKDGLAVRESGYKNLTKFFARWPRSHCACCTAISTWTRAPKQARRRRQTRNCR